MELCFHSPNASLQRADRQIYFDYNCTAIEQVVRLQCSFNCHSASLYYTRTFTYNLFCESGCILWQLRSVLSVYTWIDTLVSDRM
jgi:hypothetical protein